MKTQIEDNELKILIESIKLESPGEEFTVRVMNSIFEEQAVFEQVKREPVLRKGFWIILILFAGLFVAVAILSGSSPATDSGFSLLQKINTGALTEGYQSFFTGLDMVPLSIAGMMLAMSLLLFFEKFLSKRSNMFI